MRNFEDLKVGHSRPILYKPWLKKNIRYSWQFKARTYNICADKEKGQKQYNCYQYYQTKGKFWHLH